MESGRKSCRSEAIYIGILKTNLFVMFSCVCVCVCVCVWAQSPQTPFAELCEEGGPLFGGAAESSGGDGQEQAFLSEISEEDVEALRQREEALLLIEVWSCSTLVYNTLP
jgi:hypothetical protein